MRELREGERELREAARNLWGSAEQVVGVGRYIPWLMSRVGASDREGGRERLLLLLHPRWRQAGELLEELSHWSGLAGLL